jgi:hypothetical protein
MNVPSIMLIKLRLGPSDKMVKAALIVSFKRGSSSEQGRKFSLIIRNEKGIFFKVLLMMGSKLQTVCWTTLPKKVLGFG